MVQPPRDGPRARPARAVVVDAAVIAVVLGLLPLLWEAHLLWRLLGPLVAAVCIARAAVDVWRRVFSTAPQDLAG
jgi:hypothetical protein